MRFGRYGGEETEVAMRKQILAGLLLLSFISVGLGRVQLSQAQTKIIQAIPAKSFGWLPLFVSQDKGFYRVEGLDVITPVITTNISTPALLSGEVHLTTASPVMVAAMQGAPVKAIFFYYDRLTWLFMTRPEIRSFADLKGKNIAITAYGGDMDSTTRMLLRGNGLMDKDYTLFPLGNDPQRILALVEGHVSGGLFNPDSAAIAESRLKGIKRLAFAGDLARVPFSGLGVRAQFLVDDREVVKKFLRGTLRGLILTRDQPEEAARVAEKMFSMDRQIAFEAVKNIKGAISSKDPGGFSEQGMREWILGSAKRVKRNPVDVNIEDVASVTVLREVQREMGIMCEGGYGCSK
jgi:NitT/TauT family transport system substrate-binding protein